MAKLIALLRGVNVGGVRLAMADVRSVADGLGWTDVTTYRNSGNLVFSADEEPAMAAERLRAGLAAAGGVDVPIIMRTPPELAAALANNPFAGARYDERRVQVAFLADETPLVALDGFEAPGREEVVLAGREAFMHYPDGLGQSQLDLGRLERALGVGATMRGVRTVAGLLARA